MPATSLHVANARTAQLVRALGSSRRSTLSLHFCSSANPGGGTPDDGAPACASKRLRWLWPARKQIALRVNFGEGDEVVGEEHYAPGICLVQPRTRTRKHVRATCNLLLVAQQVVARSTPQPAYAEIVALAFTHLGAAPNMLRLWRTHRPSR